MRLFRRQKVKCKVTGDIGIVRTPFDDQQIAVVTFESGGWARSLPYRRLIALKPTLKSVICISHEYDNFILGKTYKAEATGVDEDGIPINFEVIDEEGDEFPVLPNIFEEVK